MLPINRVVLFKHGVAYYQREGKVSGNENIQLSFKTEQMNDVLKSLTTLDYSGGTFAALSYDSEEPIERRLAELTVQIPERGAITSFLDQLKGVQVTVRSRGDVYAGAIIGIEEIVYKNKSASNKDPASREPYLSILTEHAGMHQIFILDIEEIKFTEESVQRELNALMDTLAGGLNKGQKRLSIQALGDGEREVSVSYVVEAPVWKTSYRLVLSEDGGSPLLQGWAMVDNTTDEDWTQVNLSLVAGLPISFVHDLYSPRYRSRPEIKVNNEAAVAAPVVEDGMAVLEDDFDDLEAVPLGAAPAVAVAGGAMEGGGDYLSAPLRKVRSDAMRSSVKAQTKTKEQGDLFSYDITQAVDIKRGRSALVPILLSEVDADKSLYYNASIRAENPMSAFFLKNNSGLTLEGGPITVFSDDNYVGEAMLDTLKAEAEKIVPYSVELGVLVRQESFQHEKQLTKVTKQGQYIYKHASAEQVTKYVFDSKLDNDFILYFDHNFSRSYMQSAEAKNSPELVETTDNFWRYKIKLPQKQQTEYEVVEIYHSEERLFVANISSVEISGLGAKSLVSESVIAQLNRIAETVEKLNKLKLERSEKTGLIENITKGQERLRKNISSLGDSHKENNLRDRYVSKLTEEEDQIESLNEEVEAMDQQLKSLQEQIDSAVEGLELGEE